MTVPAMRASVRESSHSRCPVPSVAGISRHVTQDRSNGRPLLLKTCCSGRKRPGNLSARERAFEGQRDRERESGVAGEGGKNASERDSRRVRQRVGEGERGKDYA